ncbi:MAG: patatin family protein [Prevotella sp.]|nr:patatin family protein [Prevotella sp.]
MITTNQPTAVNKTGLVLEGGAMRGLFSAGIIDVMMEHQLWPDGVIGVSAGAAFGCNMKSRQAGRVIRYNKRFAHDWRYCSLRSLLKTGDIFGGDFCYHDLPLHLDPFDAKAFADNDMDFYAVCTDVDTGEAVYKRLPEANYECMEWIRASASMPVAAKIVNIKGQRLLDGGIADSIPLRYFQSIGYQRNIVVLTQPRDFVKKPGEMNPLINLMLRKYPNFVAASNRRHVMYNEELDFIRQQESKGQTIVLAPEEKLPVNHICHDPKLMQQTYELGRKQAEDRLEDIKRLMQ